METKSTGILRILPSREIRTNIKIEENEIFVQSTESKKYKFDKIFGKNAENSDVWESLCRGKYSLTEFLSSGISCAVITYGEVNSGKTFSLFGKENSLDLFSIVFSNLFLQYEKGLGLSIWEIVDVGNERNEQVIDLLKISDFKPLPHLFTQDFITVQVENVKEAEYVFECAKELSSNWKSKSEGGFRSINNRSHLFIRITIEKNHLYLIDLAGSLPSILSPEIRVKLGSDEQLNYTRTGLNQYRSIVWEMSKNSNITVETLLANRKSKLASIIAPIIASGKNYFFTPIKEDSSIEDIIKNLEVLNRSQNIRVFPKTLNIETTVIPLSVFLQRHKVAKYWEFKYPDCEEKEIVEDRADNKQFSRISLKEQISQMIQELEEPA